VGESERSSELLSGEFECEHAFSRSISLAWPFIGRLPGRQRLPQARKIPFKPGV